MSSKPTYEELEQRVKELEKEIVEFKKSGEQFHLFKTIVESSNEAIAISDPMGKLVYINPAHEKLFGRSLEEAQKLNYRDYYPPESVKVLDEIVAPALDRGKSWEGILDVYDVDGRRFPLWERADTVRDVKGKMLYGFGLMHDITELKKTEAVLRECDAQKTALLDASIDRIRFVDSDMRIIWANKTAVDASGMAHEDSVGKTCYQVFAGRNAPCKGCPTLRSKETERIEMAVMHQPKAKGIKGESYWDTYCVPLKNDTGTPEKFIQIARNITEQVQAKEQIHDLTHELMKAQESERQMISRELHDRVAQELAAAKIDCERLLKDQPAIHPEFRRSISEMSKTLQKSIATVRDLSYDLRPPDLDEMGLVQTLFQYCYDFSENNEINVDFHSAGLKNLKMDFDTEIQLYRLVQESLTNIKKHADASHVTVRLVAAFPNIILRIEDNGRGFDVQERLANITKEKRMGIRSIEERAKLLQGEMKLQSRPMHGTKIAIKFPYRGKKGD